jgi:aspartyl aminopeptidase
MRAIGFISAVLLLPLTSAADDDIGHKESVWERPEFAKHKKKAMKLGDDYRKFLTANKTEREVVAEAIAMAKKAGYKDLLADDRPKVKAGAKLYAVVHGKLAAFIVVGSKPLEEGVHVVASHIDSVRIDLKQNPVYGDGNMALLQTHYYGGIKQYQWLSTPLELRGIVVKKDGTTIDVGIGDDPDEPVLVIPDIAVHQSWYVDSDEGEGIPSELLDPIISSTPAAKHDAGTDPYAAEAARLLKKLYKIDVADLASAELELVPADTPRNVGIDEAMVGGYGHDDRVCAYAAMRAILDVKAPEHTAIVILADKEEIGSTGNTGARSSFFRRVVAELLEGTGESSTEIRVDRVLGESMVFSADVTGGVHPHYDELYEERDAAFMGSGVAWGPEGVHAEFLAYVRGLLDGAKIAHQPSTWGKSRDSKDEGGTVLTFFTQHGMNGLEMAIPLLSMHAPYEVVSKADIYEGYRAYRVFLND